MSDNDKNNPAWNSILEKIPAEFHPMVTPELKKWDQGVQQKFQEIHTQYEEYKPFKQFVDNNIDPDFAWQALVFTDEVRSNPKKVVEQMNEAWDLGYVSKDEAVKLGQSAGDSTDDDDLFGDEDDGDDILKNPKVKAMYDALQELQNEHKSKKEQDEEARAIEEFNKELDELEAKVTGENKPFNRMFVTALISQGADPDEAVNQYHQILAGTVNVDNNDNNDSGTDQPPVVMGNGGSIGSGTADGSVDFGSLSKSQFNDTVEQLLAARAENEQG